MNKIYAVILFFLLGGNNYSLNAQSFSEEIYVRTPTTSLYTCMDLADINSDGLKDVVVGGYGEFNCYYKANLGNNTFSQNRKIAIDKKYVYNLLTRDFNNDGFIDLLVLKGSNYETFQPPYLPGQTLDHLLTVMFNDGLGNFETAIELDSYYGFPNRDIWATDQNNDGKMDIVYNNNIYFNEGMNQFQTPFQLPGFLDWFGINQFIDFNNDGFVDLMRDNSITKTIFPGNINGFSLDSINISFDLYSVPTAFGDISGDGLVDILTFSSTQQVSQYINQGGFQFDYAGVLPFLCEQQPDYFKIEDLNSDSLGDLVFYYENDNKLLYTLKNETTWDNLDTIKTGNIDFQAYIGDFRFEDVNSDENSDLLVLIGWATTRNEGFYFKDDVLSDSSKCEAIDFKFLLNGLINFNGDEFSDLFITNWLDTNFDGARGVLYNHYVCLGGGIDCFSDEFMKINLDAKSNQILNVKYDTDNLTDALIVEYETSGNFVTRFIVKPNINNGNGEYVLNEVQYVNLINPIPIQQNEGLYLRVNKWSEDLNYSYLTFYFQQESNSSANRFVLCRYSITNGFETLIDWDINLQNFSFMTFYDWKSLQLSDLDNDGDFDIIYRNCYNQNIYILKNESNTSYSTVVNGLMEDLPSTYNQNNICLVKDLNNDGFSDILTYSINFLGTNYVSQLMLIEGVSAFQFLEPIIIFQDTNKSISDIKAVDFNHDQRIDILLKTETSFTNDSLGALWVLENNGELIFSENIISQVVSNGNSNDFFLESEQVFLNDCENDGDSDILVSDATKISLFRNRDLIIQIKNQSNDNILAFPNPTTGYLFFSTDEVFKNYREFNVFDISGSIVLKNSLIINESINISELKPGYYIIMLKNKTSTLNFQIIKI
jgi:hypothetical protein